jgi:hypothetical protein
MYLFICIISALVTFVNCSIITADYEVVKYFNDILNVKQYFLLLPFGIAREFNHTVSIISFESKVELIRNINDSELKDYKLGSFVEKFEKNGDNLDELFKFELLKLKTLQEDLLEYKMQLCKYNQLSLNDFTILLT